jgi:hypothetical protein
MELEYQQRARQQKEQEERERLQVRDEKIRQALRDSSMEIRELEHKLRLAYIGKDHVAQIKEAEARRAKDAVRLYLCKMDNLIFFRLARRFGVCRAFEGKGQTRTTAGS